MSIRTFWNIFFKIIGIWFVINLLNILPYVFASIMSLLIDVISTTSMTIYVLVMVLFITTIWLLIFRTDIIIDTLKLEKGFKEDRIDINMHTYQILSISIVIIGGITFINNFPSLCSNLIMFFQQKNLIHEYPDTKWIIYNFLQTIIGYLLIINHKRIALYIDKQIHN